MKFIARRIKIFNCRLPRATHSKSPLTLQTWRIDRTEASSIERNTCIYPQWLPFSASSCDWAQTQYTLKAHWQVWVTYKTTAQVLLEHTNTLKQQKTVLKIHNSRQVRFCRCASGELASDLNVSLNSRNITVICYFLFHSSVKSFFRRLSIVRVAQRKQ